jgi:hypothetical protein
MGEIVSLEEFRKTKAEEEIEEMRSQLDDILGDADDNDGVIGYYPDWYVHATMDCSSSDMNSQHDVREMSWSELLHACIRRLTCGKM